MRFAAVCGYDNWKSNSSFKKIAMETQGDGSVVFGEVLEISRDMTSDSFIYDDEGRLISKTIEDKDMGTVTNR